jgi:hypothetical protein
MNKSLALYIFLLSQIHTLHATEPPQITYADWVQTAFVNSNSDSAMLADPDHDGANNLTEFGFGTDPLNPNSRPAVGVSRQLSNPSQLRLDYAISADAINLLVLPQVTEDLSSGKWRFDSFAMFTETNSDPAKLSITAIDVPSGTPQQRFARIYIALDTDADGLPDDWEIAHGMNAYDGTDHFIDTDGDGDSAWHEFFQGTDPLNAQSNSAQLRIPRAPLTPLVIGTENFRVVWTDVSDNETAFRVYDGGTQIGSVGENETLFDLPPGITSPAAISVSSANPFGESPHITVEDRTDDGSSPAIDDDEGTTALNIPSEIEICQKLGYPSIRIARIDPQTIQLGWDSGPIQFDESAINSLHIRIMRQAQMGEWEWVLTVGNLSPSHNTGMANIPTPAGTTWRFSAVTVFASSSFTVGSDAAEIKVDDYVASLLGTMIYRDDYNPNMAPGGGGATIGNDNKFDWHTFSAKSFDGKSPSFLQTNPILTTPHTLHFIKEQVAPGGKRWFTDTEDDTWISYGGFVVRGREFIVSADQQARNPQPVYYPPGSIFRLDTNPLRQNTPELGIGDYNSNPLIFKLKDTTIHNPTVKVSGTMDLGFDDVTYFASQSISKWPSVNSERRLTFTPTAPTSTPFVYSKDGPIIITQDGENDVVVAPDSQNTTNIESGTVKLPLGDVEGRKAKIQLLPRKTVTVSMHKVSYLDLNTGITHEGPDPIDAAALSLYLNKVYYDQAAVELTVVHGVPIILLSSEFEAPLGTPLLFENGIPIFNGFHPTLKPKLWSYVDLSPPTQQKPDLALFFVPKLKKALGLAFAIPSRAAFIGPGGATPHTIAHEMGHCFGLYHAPNMQNPSGLPILADQKKLRLMSYEQGTILRYNEATVVNDWDAAEVDPPQFPEPQ